MRHARKSCASFFAIVVSSLVGCATTPELTFASGESASTEDASSDPGAIGSGIDGGSAPADDAVAPLTDAKPPPTDTGTSSDGAVCVAPFGGICCKDVPCVGKKCEDQCDACKLLCAGRVCCVLPNGKSASCVDTVAECQ